MSTMSDTDHLGVTDDPTHPDYDPTAYPASGYVATVNVPGYLPMDDDPPVFGTAREAWAYLADERKRDDDAWVPDNADDPDGPASLDETTLALEAAERDGMREGTIYGPTPGYDGAHDLGLAYSVTYVTGADQ
jgi:hypothetical protein